MTLQETYNFIKSLKTNTTKKSEIKIYEEFLYILSGLQAREFTKDEIKSIESELDILNFKSNLKNKKKFFKKVLNKFEKYLKDTFSLTSKRHYAKLGTGLGISYGLLFGVIAMSGFERSLGISLGMMIGMVIGLTIGRFMDSKAMSEGRVI